VIEVAPQIHLASASPRRRDILHSLAVTHSYRGVDIDEQPAANEAPDDLIVRLAREKAMAAQPEDFEDRPVLAADTIVVLDKQIFGKPIDQGHATSMLMALAGRSHCVTTAVALRCGQQVETIVSTTTVKFREIQPDEAAAYWHSGEPVDKAGGYAIQGLGGMFVTSIEGSYSGVVGLPVFETVKLLVGVGIQVLPERAST